MANVTDLIEDLQLECRQYNHWQQYVNTKAAELLLTWDLHGSQNHVPSPGPSAGTATTSPSSSQADGPGEGTMGGPGGFAVNTSQTQDMTGRRRVENASRRQVRPAILLSFNSTAIISSGR